MFRLIAALLLSTFLTIFADEHDHTYTDSEQVVLWMNTVGPYHNRQETYSYFSFPFCSGKETKVGHPHETIAEALQGVELIFSGLDIHFKANSTKEIYCSMDLTSNDVEALSFAVRNHYWYQMYIDDLPIWGVIGEMPKDNQEIQIFTHKKFSIGYNGNQIVDVNLTTEGKTKLAAGHIPLSFEVKWIPSNVKFEDRFDKYLDPNFFQHRIHWFSIFNSFMMVIFLVGLVSMILMRTLRKDYARYSKEDDVDEMERDLGDEYGWKQVHGDVFRPPGHQILFCSLIGSGYQIAFVAFCTIVIAIVGELYTERGSLLTTAIFVYAASGPFNGYFGGALYSRMGGKLWIKQMIVGSFLVPCMVCFVTFLINFVAIYYTSSRVIHLTLMLAVVCICVFVILPLNLVGTVFGRNLSGQSDYPCRINAVPRPIPKKKKVPTATLR